MALSEVIRTRAATFGGDRFPIPNKKHAALALKDLPLAKNITSSEAEQVHARAIRMLAVKKAIGRK